MNLDVLIIAYQCLVAYAKSEKGVYRDGDTSYLKLMEMAKEFYDFLVEIDNSKHKFVSVSIDKKRRPVPHESRDFNKDYNRQASLVTKFVSEGTDIDNPILDPTLLQIFTEKQKNLKQ